MDEFVNVSVRIKPFLSDCGLNSFLQIINKQPPVLLVVDKKAQTFHFDNIFTDEVSQEDIYNDTVKKLVEKVKAGYNCTVFAYGQTGTGKTYTIGTNPDIKNDKAGLIPRTLKDFFSLNEDQEVDIFVSFIEIYNEKVYDLLTCRNNPLPVKGFNVQGFKKLKVISVFEALLLLKNGSSRRHTGETKQNLNSSRSHAIFSIYCNCKNSTIETFAKLNLVDLAGSESVKKTGNQGSSLFEGININKGLLSLGQVMTALCNNSNHIPYRQSIITTILQDSLNKKNFISLIACVSENPDDLGETLQTLEFANRVKKMKNKPEVNEFISQYKKDNPMIFVRGMTPMKRSEDFYETPYKKPKRTLPFIKETSISNSNLDISPLFSSSLTSNVSETPQNFSPVIRRYMAEMESSILTKLEDVIKNTIKKPRRSSRLNKENISPKLSIGVLRFSRPTESSPKDEDFVFKAPLPKKKNTKAVKRSSVRHENTENCNRRRSVRLQMKNTNEEVAKEKTEDENTEKNNDSNRRRSVRLQKKNTNEDVVKKDSPCISCKSKTITKSKDSPITKRTKEVLQILNDGNVKELERLHTIGAKTAEKILLFRQMNGRFESVSDIAEMPYWNLKKFDKFMAENFLKRL